MHGIVSSEGLVLIIRTVPVSKDAQYKVKTEGRMIAPLTTILSLTKIEHK